jgi:hypothetical protein
VGEEEKMKDRESRLARRASRWKDPSRQRRARRKTLAKRFARRSGRSVAWLNGQLRFTDTGELVGNISLAK